MRTRSASNPRITGRDAFGPNCVAVTPGMPLRVSPSVPSRRRLSSRPFNTDTGTTSSSEPTPSGLPVTATEGRLIVVTVSSAIAWLMKRQLSANAIDLGANTLRTCAACSLARMGERCLLFMG